MAMTVKGTAFVSRRGVIEKEHGAARWAGFDAKLQARDPFFGRPVLPTTLIPERSFLTFVDLLVDEFYGGDARAHWRLGEKSAEWALTAGPYKAFADASDYVAFARTGAVLWKTYYSEGVGESKLEDGQVVLTIRDVPSCHVFYEYSVVGFFRRGLELTGAHLAATNRVRGFSRRDRDVRYELVLGT